MEQAQMIIIEEQQRIMEEEKLEAERQALLHETFTDGFIYWMLGLDNIKYRLGRFDHEANAFDCVGLFKSYAVQR